MSLFPSVSSSDVIPASLVRDIEELSGQYHAFISSEIIKNHFVKDVADGPRINILADRDLTAAKKLTALCELNDSYLTRKTSSAVNPSFDRLNRKLNEILARASKGRANPGSASSIPRHPAGPMPRASSQSVIVGRRPSAPIPIVSTRKAPTATPVSSSQSTASTTVVGQTSTHSHASSVRSLPPSALQALASGAGHGEVEDLFETRVSTISLKLIDKTPYNYFMVINFEAEVLNQERYLKASNLYFELSSASEKGNLDGAKVDELYCLLYPSSVGSQDIPKYLGDLPLERHPAIEAKFVRTFFSRFICTDKETFVPRVLKNALRVRTAQDTAAVRRLKQQAAAVALQSSAR